MGGIRKIHEEYGNPHRTGCGEFTLGRWQTQYAIITLLGGYSLCFQAGRNYFLA